MKKRRKFKDPTKRTILFRKINKGILIKMWNLHIYLVGHAMKERKRSKSQIQKNRLRVIRLQKLHDGKGCQLCGKFLTAETSELHHIKPLSLYPHLKCAPENLMLLCHECHVGLHKEAQRKAYELITPDLPI